jgi:hypothetical protein
MDVDMSHILVPSDAQKCTCLDQVSHMACKTTIAHLVHPEQASKCGNEAKRTSGYHPEACDT